MEKEQNLIINIITYISMALKEMIITGIEKSFTGKNE